MKERPINLRPHEVRGIIDGRQTQIRRVVKFKPWHQIEERDDGSPWPWMYDEERDTDHWLSCPYGAPGDRLWGRESFIHEPADYCWEASVSIPCRPAFTAYRADAEDPRGGAWKPSTQMPRELSRITLDLISVRVERLHNISETDALAEGVTPKWEPGCSGRLMEALGGFSFRPAASAYADLWEQLNGPGSWGANPWVWVLDIREV